MQGGGHMKVQLPAGSGAPPPVLQQARSTHGAPGVRPPATVAAATQRRRRPLTAFAAAPRRRVRVPRLHAAPTLASSARARRTDTRLTVIAVVLHTWHVKRLAQV